MGKRLEAQPTESVSLTFHSALRKLNTQPSAILVSDWSISKKSSPLKLLSHMNRNLVGSIYVYRRLCIKFPQSRMKGEIACGGHVCLLIETK
jgi:hypothetical protein